MEFCWQNDVSAFQMKDQEVATAKMCMANPSTITAVTAITVDSLSTHYAPGTMAEICVFYSYHLKMVLLSIYDR